MPLVRYFLWVGGVLLTLLFVADACLPKPPLAAEHAASLPSIRLHSDRKWPERIVFDTSAPMLRVAQAGSAVVDPPAPPPPAGVLPPGLREALAQMRPSDVAPPQPSKQAKRTPPKPQRKIARNRIPRPALLLAARPTQSGWFGRTMW
jgi:hypothetical protein